MMIKNLGLIHNDYVKLGKIKETLEYCYGTILKNHSTLKAISGEIEIDDNIDKLGYDFEDYQDDDNIFNSVVLDLLEDNNDFLELIDEIDEYSDELDDDINSYDRDWAWEEVNRVKDDLKWIVRNSGNFPEYDDVIYFFEKCSNMLDRF